MSCVFHISETMLLSDSPLAWATRTLIVRKLKGLEDIICEYTLS